MRYRRTHGVEVTELDGELFLVPPEDTEIVYLDRMGAAVWRLLETPHAPEEIHAVFAEAFPDVPAERLRADLDQAIQALLDMGVVEDAA
jgi:hypothetical protein